MSANQHSQFYSTSVTIATTMMNKFVFLMAASLVLVNEAHSSRLFKRDVMAPLVEDVEGIPQGLPTPPPQSCGSCKNMVFEIKCGGDYTSDHCGDCALFCDCKDESTYPTPPPPTYPPPQSIPPAEEQPATVPSGSNANASGGGGGGGTNGYGSGFGLGSSNASSTNELTEANALGMGGGGGGGGY